MKQLTISDKAKQKLYDERKLGETYSDTIIRLCETCISIMED